MTALSLTLRYAAFASTATKDLRSTSWSNKDLVDESRLATEKEAFEGLIKNPIDDIWVFLPDDNDLSVWHT